MQRFSLWMTTPSCWHCCVSSCGAQDMAISELPKAALLRKLAENRGHIVTYDALCAAVWGADYYGYENSLGVHIRHLREKLEAEPGAPQFLRTVRGIGYKLTKGEEA